MQTIWLFTGIVFFSNVLSAQNQQNVTASEARQEGGAKTTEGISFIHENVSEALSKAKTENKLIFVDAYTTWCGPCKMMVKNTFPDADVASLFNVKFVNLKMDMEKGDGIDMAKRYEIAAYPTLLFIDGDGQLIHKAIGFHDVSQILELGKTALDADKSLGGWASKYEKGNRDAAFLKEYALKLAAAYDNRRTMVAEEYLATQKDWTTDENLELIYRFTEGVNTKFFDYFLNNKKAFEKKYNAAEIDVKIQGLVSEKLFNEKNLPTLGFADSLIKKVYADKSDRMSKNYHMSYYRLKGDREKYAQAAVAYLKKYKDSAEELSDIASTFNEQIGDRKMLKKALGWAKKAVKMDNSYLNNMTLANLYQSLDKKSDAQKAAQKAIDIAKKNDEPYSEAEELLKNLK